MKKLLLLVTSIMASLSSFAYDFEHNGYYYNIISLGDLTAELTCSGDETLNSSWYNYDKDKDKYQGTYSGSITVPTTAEYLGKTFSVISIHPAAFQYCTIETLTIPKEIQTFRSSLYGIFNNVIIEDGDTPFTAYSYDNSLTYHKILNSIYIGRDFGDKKYYMKVAHSVTFGPKVTSIPKNFCKYCYDLEEVNLSNNISSIGEDAFRECESLKVITGGTGVTTIGNSAFSGCKSLVDFPFTNVKSIGYSCFYKCAFKALNLPPGLIELGVSNNSTGDPFSGCQSLETLHLPATLVSTPEKLVSNCNALKTISVGAPIPIVLKKDAFTAQTCLNVTLKVPVGAKEAYSQADVWKEFFNIEEDPSITDDIYTLKANSPYGGTLEVNADDVMEQYGKYRFIKKGSTINVVVTPNDNYIFKALTVNDVDVTSEVVDNTYSFTVNGSVNVNASFEYYYNPQPEKDIYLAIKQADNGSVKLKASKWSIYNFMITPADGWTIHSVTFNGQDVTSEVGADGSYTVSYINDDSELVVAFEERISSISSPFASNARVFASYGNIIVKDADQGEAIVIYDESGKMHTNTISDGGTQTFDVPMSGIYIVKVGNKTVKVGL